MKASIKEDHMLEEWIIAAIMRNLPKQITKDLAIELKKATSIDDIHNTINVYMHDYQTGMPRNMPGPMLYMTEQNQDDKTEAADSDKDKGKEKPTQADANYNGQEGWDLNAASKGGKGKGSEWMAIAPGGPSLTFLFGVTSGC